LRAECASDETPETHRAKNILQLKNAKAILQKMERDEEQLLVHLANVFVQLE
jgi:hypothetical protein